MGTACNWCSDFYQHLQNLNDKLQTLATSGVTCPVLMIPVPKDTLNWVQARKIAPSFVWIIGFILEDIEDKTKWEGKDRLKLSLGYNSQITAVRFHTTAGSGLSYSEHDKGGFYLYQHTDACGLFSLRKKKCVNISVWFQIDFEADLLIWLLHLAKQLQKASDGFLSD